MYTHNPSFKSSAAASAFPGRSPSPPRRYVEPLSPRKASAKPAKPVPIEPNFNYPPLNDNVHFTVRPEQAYDAYIATPKSRNRSSSHKSQHHRTPSTIDTLAEAALAMSPPYQVQTLGGHNRHSYPQPVSTGHGMSEPPHKRSRSEILPSPLVSQYASRPATSYEQGQHWYGAPAQLPHAAHTYDSRIEEASLLLNFRTGGLPMNNHNHNLPPPPMPNAHVPPAPRPHANSFPQDTPQARPLELASQAGLLPPFNPQSNTLSRPTLPSPQQTIESSEPSPKPRNQSKGQHWPVPFGSDQPVLPRVDVEMLDAPPQQTQTPPEDPITRATSSATSAEVAVSETSESGPIKARRDKPRGKAKVSIRKGLADKAAAKKAASRKKTPETSKVSWNANEVSLESEIHRNRRKSLDDTSAFDRPAHNLVAERRARSVPRDTPLIIRSTSPAKATRRSHKATVEVVICGGCETTRETTSVHGELDQWISCNGCRKWFHVDCAGFNKASEVRDVDKYFCTACELVHGKTTYVRKSTRAHASVDYAELQRGVLKTSEESVEHHYVQPIKDGTFQFDPETFPRMRPELVTREFFEKSGTFVEPICIPAEWNPRPWLAKQSKTSEDSAPQDLHEPLMSDHLLQDFEYDTVPDDGQDRLGMVMPENLSVRQVCNLVGPEVPLDVIDVKTQNSGSKWTLSRWADYYDEKTEDKPIRNVISLEVSQSKLGRMLRRPQIVRDIDLQDQVWPQKEIELGKWPKVQYYCLMSVADSYTDFHIDFGGSSVYYHILKGKKTFFFIPPKTKHLKAYEEWNDSPQQNYTFLPNITKECYRVDLSEGDTMLIPSGWIHAVWTPETSLVIGGNFLNRMSYKNQFKVVEIEKNNNTPMKFRYPFFQKIMWYTAIQYLEQDPLPEAVSRLFHEGKKYERTSPVWADFDGEFMENKEQPGAHNARYYSQAEIEGLPDLCNYIFRTVMLVMGRVEGISADRMKRVNASIPKGHGEPLEIAKTFALWVAWKCGNEDPPAWAHPDAVLPASKDEDAPKKLSARALKEMERKEAIAAWRIAPDRQSARVKSAAAAAGSATNHPIATPDRTSSYPPTSPIQASSNNAAGHQMALPQAMPVAQPMQLMMNEMAGQYISTPKTSVLGPKRVACDVCRKRRIRCKHKDLVLQAPNTSQMSPSDLHENITVTPQKPPSSANVFTNGADAQQDGLQPGTNAYINANIPMAMNGSAMFGELSKRGRSKACFECRKSKRRCIHDDTGNIDPIKAAETPVPRGSMSAKKRPAEDSSPLQVKKKSKSTPPADLASYAPPASFHSPNQQPPEPQQSATHQAHIPVPVSSTQRRSSHEQLQPPLDPKLFSAYPEPTANGSYSHSYPYPAANPYQLQSLEQIANEVLDMNHEEDVHVFQESMPNGLNSVEPLKPDESVDSAISLPSSDDGKQAHHEETATAPEIQHSLEAQTSVNLPLYRPPPPPSQSPEQSKRPIHVTSGSIPNANGTNPSQLTDSATGPAISDAQSEDAQNVELAKLLQQDEIGLRRRSK